MIVTIQYRDSAEAVTALKVQDYIAALQDISNYLRQKTKYEDPDAETTWGKIREEFYRLLEQHDVQI